jgi:Spy/CpxP family protein refolding chaperone
MKKLLSIIAIAVLLVGSITVTALAFGPGNGACPGGKRTGFGMRGLNSLNLTNDQQQKVLAIRQEFEKDTLSLRQDMRKKRQELRQLWSAETLNQAAIDAKTKEMNTLRIQFVQESKEMFHKVKAILTPEQLKQLESLKQNREKGQGFRGRRGGGGNGCPGLEQ